MTILLLSGWSTAGKDTVGEILVRSLGARRLAFADTLKEMVAAEYGFPIFWTRTEIGKQTMLPCGYTVRELLIKRGQEIREEMNDPGFFAHGVRSKIATCPNHIVITDWRLPCEYDVINETCYATKQQLITIRVVRDGLTTSPIEDTLTEHQLDNWPFDIYIKNPGTNLAELELEVMNQIISRVE
jgi:hypothetical protein